MMDAPAAQAGLRDQEALPFPAEQVVARHAHVLVADVGVMAVAERLVAEPGQADDVQPRRVARDEEHRRALVDGHVGIRHDHRDQELGEVGVRGEVLLAVDHPRIAVAHGAQRNSRGSAPPCGSVIEKQETMSPSRRGFRYFRFCSSVP
jgi:hypothetical protein